MSTPTDKIAVLAAPHLDPGMRRVELDVPEGLTLAEIVRAALPGMVEADLAQVRVTLVTPHGSEVIPQATWSRVRPKAGVRVVIRVIAGKNAVRSILTIVVAVAAIAIGAYFAPMLAGTFGLGAATWSGLIAAGVSVVGNMLINALIPPVTPEDRNAENRYTISGFKNRAEPNGAVPLLFGALRYAPPYGALSYTEIVGDWQYVRCLFVSGEGRIQIDDIRIGETSISEFTNVEIETRAGVEEDDPLTLYPRQVAEESVGVELTRPLPRDELGEVIDGEDAEAAPVTRTTGADAKGASIVLAFPSGMIRYDDEGRSHSEAVSILVEQRPVEAEEWQEVTTLNIKAKKLESFFRQHTWDFPSRGRWQVRLTMLTDENTDSQIQRRTSWAALQTLRPEYPIAYPRPLSLISVRIKATHQLSGALDNLSILGSLICLDWDAEGEEWVERATSNPASLYRHALQAASNPKAVSDVGIDLDQLQDWHDFCAAEGLHFNEVFEDTGTPMRDVLTQIAAAGRATPRHDGVRWGVTVDQPQELIVDHLDPLNSSDFRATRSYIEHPHAFRVRFKDETNDFKEAERVVRWPGYEGEISVTEALDLPGITNPDIIWREARRRQYEAIYRCDAYQLTQDGPTRTATRGDKVVLSHYVLDAVQASARVRDVMGQLLELDQPVTMVEGGSYVIRFRVFEDRPEGEEPDTIGTSVLRSVRVSPGEHFTIVLTGTGVGPEVGTPILFGEASNESLPLIVRGIERAEENDEILHLVDEALIIDQLLAADEIPAWSGRAGDDLGDSTAQPGVPRFSAVTSGIAGTGSADQIDYLLEADTGGVSTAQFEVAYRLSGETAWTSVFVPVANGGGSITEFVSGDVVEMRVRALSATGVESAWSAILSIEIGVGDADIPAALDEEGISITTLLGGALIQLSTGSDTATTGVQVYRSTSDTLDRSADAVGTPHAVSPMQSFSIALGDTTRQELVVGGGMNDAGAWVADAGWAVGSGLAQHTAGTADAISQAFETTAGKFYRLAFTVTGLTAGSVTPQLTGGSVRSGTVIYSDGDYSDRIQAVTGNDILEFLASSDLAGAVTDVSAYLETDACLVQGTHFIWLEPSNDDGVPGPLAGPFTVHIA